ncbi:hypothetical protein Tco_1119288, partial [Tanacetum coccineum]
THPRIQAFEPEKTTIKGKEEIPEQSNEKEETAKFGQSSPFHLDREVNRDKKEREKDELPKAPNESKPPEKVIIHDGHSDQTVTIGGNLTTKCRTGLIEILRNHADAFAWTPTDMTGIPRFIAEHELKTYPHIEPRVQRKRSIAPDRRKVVKEEINDSEYQYAVSIKEDTTYPCLYSPKTTKETSSIRRIQRRPIRRIEDICMTRSSTNELFTPYKEPEREFRSSRRHFKTLSLDELRSHDFNSFSDQEYSEEEVAKAMAETMEQYMSKTRADYGTGVARPKIEDKDNFELKGQFLKELRTNTFSSSDH